MVIRHFLKWIGNARVSERVAAAEALARAYLGPDLDFEDRCEAEAALTLLLDDPSAKVRQALAEAFSMSPHAPVQIVTALASDQKQVAAPILIRSPLLNDIDLIDRVADGCDDVQALIASRPYVSMALAAAIAEIGGERACRALLENEGADIASLSFRRLAERFGSDGRMRETMLRDRRLPCDCRHLLLVKVGEALRHSPLVVAMMGASQADRLLKEACAKASITIIDRTKAEEHAALVGHLRMRGDLTAAFLVRAVAHGKIDFFGAALTALSGKREERVRAMLAGGRDGALCALLGAAGLHETIHGVIVSAIRVWREVAAGRRIAGAQEVSWLMLKHLGAAPGQAGPADRDRELAALIRSIHLCALRDNARFHALAIAAA